MLAGSNPARGAWGVNLRRNLTVSPFCYRQKMTELTKIFLRFKIVTYG